MLSQPQGHSAAGRIVSMKNSSDTIGNRTRDLLACSAVPQPTAPPCVPNKRYNTPQKIDNFTFKNVESFNYLGSILNADNKMNIEISEKIAKGNKAYYVNSKLIKSKFLKKKRKTLK